MTWTSRPIVAFDLETTGVDPEQDRIVSASTVRMVRGEQPEVTTLLVNPGIPIPASASAIHGITDADVADALVAAEAVRRIVAVLAQCVEDGTPVVGMNLAYDLTMLDRECRRNGVEGLDHDRLTAVDALILDKQVDRFRPGGRRLDDLCRHYGVELSNAHSSAADALASANVAIAIVERSPRIAKLEPRDLHRWQIRWAAEQAESFRSWLQRRGDARAADIDGSWPLRQR